MAAKMSEIAIKVQEAINAINEQVDKFIFDEPLTDRGQPGLLIIPGSISFSVAIEIKEAIRYSDQRLITLLKTRLINTLLDTKSDLDQGLKKLGYVEPQVNGIQGL